MFHECANAAAQFPLHFADSVSFMRSESMDSEYLSAAKNQLRGCPVRDKSHCLINAVIVHVDSSFRYACRALTTFLFFILLGFHS